MQPLHSSVLTLADLDSWSFDGTALAVLGHPIKHSISPAMHNAALGEMSQRNPQLASWRYFRFDVPPDQLGVALRKLHACGFQGINLTVPHKVIAFGQVERTDPAAQPIGAVNTLRRLAEGWEGFNTDGYGLATAVAETLGRHLAGSPVILLGAGGAARGAAVECIQRGATVLAIGNRTASTRDDLLRALAPLAGATRLIGFDPAHPPAELPADALLINATSAGLRPDDPMPTDLRQLPRPAGVYEMIYNPAETALLREARALGLPHANGLSMLVHQGARALELWTATPVPVATMRAAAEAALLAKA